MSDVMLHIAPPKAERALEPAALLKRMLEITSLSGQESVLANFLCAHAGALGLNSVIDDAGNFVATTHGDPLCGNEWVKDIVLLGHMDVVPGKVSVRVEGDLLYGRGAVDAKGPLATFLLAAARVRPSLPKGVRVVVIGAVEEEAASSKGARAVVPRYEPAACVIGEPSRWDSVTIGYKGRLLVRYTMEQAMAHTAGPQFSVGDCFVRWWHQVLGFVAATNEERTGAFQSVQATLRHIHTESDGLADRCEATVAFRLPPDVSPGQIAEQCKAHEAGARLEFSGAEEAVVANRLSPLARALTMSIRTHGGKPTFVMKTGTSDMNVVGATGHGWTCPMVAYGPGDSSLDHTPGEHVSLAEFSKAIDVLERALLGVAATLTGTDAPRSFEP
jgi:[amino group carrier protein]-lysine/ornithine hydrolase